MNAKNFLLTSILFITYGFVIFANQPEQAQNNKIMWVKVHNVAQTWFDPIKLPVWVPQNHTKTKLNASFRTDGEIEFAPEDIHHEVITIQQRFGLDERPTIVFTTETCTAQTFIDSDLVLITLHKELLKKIYANERRAILCHENAHVLANSTERTHARRNFKKVQLQTERFGLASIASVVSTFVPKKLLPRTIARIAKPASILASSVFSALYCAGRLVGKSYQETLHKEELECDKMAIEKYAKTLEEKKTMLKYTRDALALTKILWPESQPTWTDHVAKTLFPYTTHPSYEVRHAQLQKMEQELEHTPTS